jgi:hypothetical protein
MANNRIFYACQAVAAAPCPYTATQNDNSGFTTLHGVQSVGINTTFNLEQAFELGQIAIYQNIEGVPEVEVTLEKVLDGYPLLYRMVTRGSNAGEATDNTLVNRTKQKCALALGIYDDDKIGVSGAPKAELLMSGLYITNVSYNMPTDGNFTESITLVGNHKQWNTHVDGVKQQGGGAPLAGSFFNATSAAAFNISPGFSNDEPANIQNINGGQYFGGVQRRQHVIFASSVMPSSIFGIGKTLAGTPIVGTGNNWDDGLKAPIVHIQSISISADIGRDPIYELGRKFPYTRTVTFPLEVKTELTVISVSGDFVSSYENGLYQFNATKNEGSNTPEEHIAIKLNDKTHFGLGSKNRLTSVTYGGGDAGGGNATMTYSYSTFNDLTVRGPHDNVRENTWANDTPTEL